MTDSILDSTKKTLGIEADYTVFDIDILMHINTIFSVLNQLGIGPNNGFRVEDASAVWPDFYGADTNYNMVKTYVYLRVRILFDPPQTGFLLDAMTKQYQEIEWRLNVQRESGHWVDPNPTRIPLSRPEHFVLDGGLAG